MKIVIENLFLSLSIWIVVAILAVGITGLIYLLGVQYPHYGLPIFTVMWMGLAWVLTANKA